MVLIEQYAKCERNFLITALNIEVRYKKKRKDWTLYTRCSRKDLVEENALDFYGGGGVSVL